MLPQGRSFLSFFCEDKGQVLSFYLLMKIHFWRLWISCDMENPISSKSKFSKTHLSLLHMHAYTSKQSLAIRSYTSDIPRGQGVANTTGIMYLADGATICTALLMVGNCTVSGFRSTSSIGTVPHWYEHHPLLPFLHWSFRHLCKQCPGDKRCSFALLSNTGPIHQCELPLRWQILHTV